MRHTQTYRAFILVFQRELRRLVSRPLYLFCMVIAPLSCLFFFTSLMDTGLPTNLPVGVVDLDQTAKSRSFIQNLDALPQTEVVQIYTNIIDARKDVQRGKLYGFYLVPKSFSKDAQAQKQPTLSFYINNSYLIAGSLLFKDMKKMGELAAGAAMRSVLYAKGATEKQAMGFLQPIVIDTHPLNNPTMNYSVYLSNTLVPGIMMLMILITTVFAIGVEIKERTARMWLRIGNQSIHISILGKLLPQTFIFMLVGIFYNFYFYVYLGFPCVNGVPVMLFNTLLLILASQALGVTMIGTFPSLRLGLSFASLWGVLSVSMSGFTFPVMGMHPVLQSTSYLFPLRHYFLIYVDQALNGFPLSSSYTSIMALLVFILLPFLVFKRLKRALQYEPYIP